MEHECKVIAYKVDTLMGQVARLEEAERTHSQALLGERIDRERISQLRADIDRIDNAQKVTDGKQDKRLAALEDVVNRRSGAWDEAVDNQKKILWGVITAAASAFISVAGSIVFWAAKHGAFG